MKASFSLLVIALLFAIAPVCLYAQWESGDLGETGIFKMENAPYPHESRKDGYTYNDKTYSAEEHYSDSSVVLFLPKGFSDTGRVNLLFYYHGWGNNVRKALDKFKLREMVAASGKNVVLVFPEGPVDASDSGLGKLEDKDGLKNLATEVVAKLKSEKKIAEKTELGDVILSGHSGAYRGIAFGLHQGGLDDHITEAYLLDASYANLDYYIDWVTAGPHRRLRSIFTDHLAPENAEMMGMLSKKDVPFGVRIDKDLDAAALAKYRILYVYTPTLKHNETVQLLETFLKESSLPEISAKP